MDNATENESDRVENQARAWAKSRPDIGPDIGPGTRPGFGARVRIVANPDVWLEGEATRQLEQVAVAHDCVAAVGMPDLHPGAGIPIGAVFGFAETVHPRLIGSDAGCGVLAVSLGKLKLSSTIERRVRGQFEGPPLPGMDGDALYRAIWQHGLRGVAGSTAMPDGLQRLMEQLLSSAEHRGRDMGHEHRTDWLPGDFGSALGTIGGGNHFAEIGRVSRIYDAEEAEKLRIGKGHLMVLCHSGSRGLGKALADRWGHRALHHTCAQDYLSQLARAVDFARVNRMLIAWRMLRALGVSRPGKIHAAFDIVHNSVDREEVIANETGDNVSPPTSLWVHRKGCAPAHDGQPTVVLGSRGTASWIMRGRGNGDGLSSVAHGAGRKMRRSEARAKLRARYQRKQLARLPKGSTVICNDAKLLYEEHPDAYKPVEPIIESLEQAGLADRVAAIEPVLTVKM